METTLKRLRKPGRDNFVYMLTKFFFSSLTACELYYFSAYLTDGAMFSVGVVSLVLSLTSIIDTLFSLVNGVVLQKIGDLMPWGTYRSWLLVAPPLTLVTFIFCFVRVSANEMVSAVVIIIAFAVSHMIWSVGESALITMSVVMTDDTDERAAMSISLGRGSLGSTLIFGLVGAPLIGVFNNMTGGRFGYMGLAMFFGVLNCLAYWWLFAISKGCEDDKATRDAKRERAAKAASVSSRTATVPQMYKVVFTSKNTIAMIICVMLYYAHTFMISATMVYYFQYCLNTPAIMGIFISIRALVGLASGWWIPILLKLCGGNKKKAYIISYLIAFVGYFIIFLVRPSSFPLYAVLTLVTYFLSGGGSMLQTAMYADCAVECEYKSGKDVRGMVMSFMSLPIKLGVVIRSGLVSAALTMVGYTAGMAATPQVVNGFNMAYLLWPALLALGCAVVALLIYKLPESRVTEMIAENDRRALADQKAVETALAKMEQN